MSTSHDTASGTIKKFDTENMAIAVENFVAMCSRTRDMPGGKIPPPQLPANVVKKLLPGQGLKITECQRYNNM